MGVYFQCPVTHQARPNAYISLNRCHFYSCLRIEKRHRAGRYSEEPSMKMHLAASKARAMFGVSVAILAAILLAGCRDEEEASERPPRPVRTVAVSFNPEDTYGSLVGEIRPRTE